MTLSAVLLAGGESRRMGRDKATVIFGGEPLWQRQIRTLRAAPVEQLFVSARSQCEWLPAGIDLVSDAEPSRGPLSGIAAALSRIATSHLLVLAVDMPFISVADLRRLCAGATSGAGVVPQVGERFEPLAAIYPKTAAAEFAVALASDDWSLQTLLRRLVHSAKMKVLDCHSKAAVFRSVNVPEDLEQDCRLAL